MKYYIVETHLNSRQLRIVRVVDNYNEAVQIMDKLISKNKDNYVIFSFWNEDSIIRMFKISLQKQPSGIILPI